MLKRKHIVTICVDNEYHLDMQRFIDENVKTIGSISNYVDDHKSYTAFETKMDTVTIANQLQLTEKNVICYFRTVILGDLIIVS